MSFITATGLTCGTGLLIFAGIVVVWVSLLPKLVNRNARLSQLGDRLADRRWGKNNWRYPDT